MVRYSRHNLLGPAFPFVSVKSKDSLIRRLKQMLTLGFWCMFVDLD